MGVSARYAGNRSVEDAWNLAVEIVQHRRRADSLAKRQMIEVAERYNHAVVFPLDDVEGEPEFPAIAAMVVSESIDGFATRANDTRPYITAPAVDPTAKNHRARADTRKHVWGSIYHKSQLPLRMGRAYRQLFGYATWCFYAYPQFTDEQGREVREPRIETRDPLTAYPEPTGNDEIRAPANIGFVYGRSPEALLASYPEAAGLIKDNYGTDEDMWDVLDWTDKDWRFIGIIGKRASQSFARRYDAAGNYSVYGDQPMDQTFLLRAFPNRIKMVPAVCPTAVTLDRQISSIMRILPSSDVMNKLAALQFIAAEKGVFPHIVVLADESNQPEIVGGEFRDGRSGEANVIKGARAVDLLNIQPPPSTDALLSNLERNARNAAGSPSLFQGELNGSVRSGQTVSQLGAYSVDPRLREAHEIMGYSLGVMNEATAAIYETYWPNRSYTVFSGWPGSNRHINFKPSDIFNESKESVVCYPMPGMDVQNATLAIASLNQARMLSRRSGMEKHPLVDDPVAEERNMVEESLDDAIVMTAVQLVSTGELAWTDLALVRAKVRKGMDIEVAIAEAQEEAQKRQAEQAPPPEAGQVMPPEAMPGLNAPMAGGQMAPPAAPPQGAPSPADAASLEQIFAAMESAPPGAGGAMPAGAPV